MLSSATRFRARGTVVLSLFVVAAVAAACAAGAPASSMAPVGPGGQGPGATAAGAPPGGPLSGEAGGNGNGNGNGNSSGQAGGEGGVVDQAGLLIVKNGSLAIQVGGIDAAIGEADQQIGGLGGYASASSRSGDGETAQATVTYRIPVARWEEALSILRGLGEKVLDERFSTEEVTAQVVDLTARITNLRATEAAVQGIMDRAVEIDDVLRVQAELTRIRSEIEQLTAQKTNLEGRAAFSTLAVTFALKPANPVVVEQEGYNAAAEVDQASATLVAVLQELATAGIWFGIVWLPILLTVTIVTLSVIAVVRRLSRRIEGDGDAPLPSPGTGG